MILLISVKSVKYEAKTKHLFLCAKKITVFEIIFIHLSNRVFIAPISFS